MVVGLIQDSPDGFMLVDDSMHDKCYSRALLRVLEGIEIADQLQSQE